MQNVTATFTHNMLKKHFIVSEPLNGMHGSIAFNSRDLGTKQLLLETTSLLVVT